MRIIYKKEIIIFAPEDDFVDNFYWFMWHFSYLFFGTVEDLGLESKDSYYFELFLQDEKGWTWINQEHKGLFNFLRFTGDYDYYFTRAYTYCYMENCDMELHHETMLKEFFRYICWIRLLNSFDFFNTLYNKPEHTDDDYYLFNFVLDRLLLRCAKILRKEDNTISSFLFSIFILWVSFIEKRREWKRKFVAYKKTKELEPFVYFVLTNYDLWLYVVLFYLYLNCHIQLAGILVGLLISLRWIFFYYFRFLVSCIQSCFLKSAWDRFKFLIVLPLKSICGLGRIMFVFSVLSIFFPGTEFLSLLVTRYFYSFCKPYWLKLRKFIFKNSKIRSFFMDP